MRGRKKAPALSRPPYPSEVLADWHAKNGPRKIPGLAEFLDAHLGHSMTLQGFGSGIEVSSTLSRQEVVNRAPSLTALYCCGQVLHILKEDSR